MSTGGFRFMGEQDDVELAVWQGRGLRVYDGTEPREPEEVVPVSPPHPRAENMNRSPRLYWNTCADCHCGHTRTGRCAFAVAPHLP